MEVYLNSIEMGDGIYGAQAVAKEHFGCEAKDLSRAQSALIAVSLPNPIRFNSQSPSRYMYRRQSRILREMQYLERVNSEFLK
jgi:monofunctional biosynthetic peptidoglycan transglycosylase